MRLEKVSLILVAVVAVVALAVPFWRGLAGSQLRQAVPWSAKNLWKGDTSPSIPNPHPKTNAQLLKERPNDFLLRLALTQELYDWSSERFKPQGQQAVRALVRDFPKQGVVYVLAAKQPQYADADIPFRKEGNWMADEEAPKDWIAPPPPTKSQLDRVERSIRLMDAAIAADPGNGYFHYIRALYLYGLHRDDEALREIHLAAAAPQFTDYTELLAQAAEHVCDLHGDFDPIARAFRAGMTMYPVFASMRNGARITGHLAYDQIRSGNTGKGITIALDQTTVGYSMLRHAPTLIHALVGKSIMAIGARAIDPAFDPQLRTRDAEAVAKLEHYKKVLVDQGHSREAAALNEQWSKSSRVAKRLDAYFDTELTAGTDALLYYPAVFAVATVVLGATLICALGWAAATLFTARGGAGSFWDKRAAIVSGSLSALLLAPLITVLARPVDFSPFLFGRPEETQHSGFLLVPLAVGLAALLCGAVVMTLRAPVEGRNRRMPVWSLLIAYVSAAAALVQVAYNLDYFILSSSALKWVESAWLMILYPTAALLVYGLIRASQARFGRVRGSAPLAFASTLRYGSAIAVGIFAVAYICLLVMTAHYGAKADVAARQTISGEAAFIRSAFRSR